MHICGDGWNIIVYVESTTGSFRGTQYATELTRS